MTEETKTPLAERVEGHWTSDAGYEMATRYATMTRAQLCGGDLTDMEAAYRVAMIMRDDLDHESGLTIGKDRIRWLSVQLAASQARQRELKEALRDALAAAYEQGCLDVQANYRPDPDPEFGEAARDYAHSALVALLNSPAGEQPECPDCPKYFGKCPTCHRPRPRPAAPSPTGGE